MQHSEQLNELATALAAAQAELRHAPKTSENPFFRSHYADLASVWDVCRPVLGKHGLSVVQLPGTSENGVSITTMMLHKSGQWIADTLTIPMEKSTPQSMGSAITYGRRYALSAVVGIASEDDDGNDAERHGNNGKQNTTPPKMPTKPAEPSKPRLDRQGIFEAFKTRGISDDRMTTIMAEFLTGLGVKTLNGTTLADRQALYNSIVAGDYDTPPLEGSLAESNTPLSKES
ncbi:MAG: ERF family protein [Sulfuricaulis sp.]|nr:ERF family protein [Sulfuricaulis sp.]